MGRFDKLGGRGGESGDGGAGGRVGFFYEHEGSVEGEERGGGGAGGGTFQHVRGNYKSSKGTNLTIEAIRHPFIYDIGICINPFPSYCFETSTVFIMVDGDDVMSCIAVFFFLHIPIYYLHTLSFIFLAP